MRNVYASLVAAFALVVQPSNRLLAQCSTTNATSCVCRTSGQTNCQLLPDITISWSALANYAGGPNEYPQNDASNPGRLRVTGSTPNVGYGPLNVRGVDQNGYRWFLCGVDTISVYDPNSDSTFNDCANPKQLILQRIYRKNGSSMTFTEHFAGTMTYHPTHGHNHVDDWATFTLRTEVPGEPDARNWPIVGEGAKVGFCLMDYYACSNASASGHCRTSQMYNQGTALNSNSNFPNYGLGGAAYNCSQISQGISVGWTDVYSESLDGMWVNIPPNTCNGNYWIVMEVDPNNNFVEENDNNNWTAAPFTLTQQVPAGSASASITPSTSTTLCAGSPITLTASAGSSYLWSNGSTTQTISPTSSGTYGCTVTSPCGTAAAQPLTVNFVNTSAPSGTGATIPGPGQATLQATGSNVRWFDAAVAGGQVGTGASFLTPPITQTTNYWAEAQTIQQQSSAYVGKTTNTGGGGYGDFDQHLTFNAFQPFTLRSVKVYAQSAGNRTFQVLTSGGSLITQTTVNVPTGESRVTLNLSVPIGTNMRLKVTTALLNMYRNNAGVSYPYTIGGVVSITGSSAGAAYYYYCYDWEVRGPDLTCSSQRTMVTATVTDGVVPDIKVLLEGPFDPATGKMTDGLRAAGSIPLTEPFTGLGFVHAGGGGGETTTAGLLNVTGDAAVVDWVLIELRNASLPGQVVATRSALVTRTGQVISTTGSTVRLSVPEGNYHVAVRHRNHLGCMTASPVALSGTPLSIDLRSAATASWGSSARKQDGSTMLLWAGNVVRNTTLKYTGESNDRDPILSAIGGTVPTNTTSGYMVEDVNLDGLVKYTGNGNDRDPILSNIGGSVPTNTRTEQLP
ncbi:MAG: hypothetical protein IPG92_13020 [Flavobacteriales bacterium]|nr:hypothetical protein [Flavobacteriales bacterium]